jgi:hypothetical protein
VGCGVNLLDVMQELSAAADTIPGLNCFWWPPDRVSPPVFLVSLPESIDYHSTYARGMDEMTLDGYLLVGKADDRASVKQLAPYCDGAGDQSIVQALESGTYTACDSVTVAKAQFEVVTVGAVEHLGVHFTINIAGSGA